MKDFDENIEAFRPVLLRYNFFIANLQGTKILAGGYMSF
jgi:hypothetical protein